MIFSDGNCIIFKLDSSEILTYLTVYMYSIYVSVCVLILLLTDRESPVPVQ